MPKYWIFDVVSKSGKPVSPTGRPHDSIAVYDKADLNRRIAAAERNPDLHITVREAKRSLR